MGKSNESWSKKELEKKRNEKRKQKEQRKLDRKEGSGAKSFDDMIAYVDAFGNITSTPPDPMDKVVTNVEDIEISVRKKEELESDIIRTGIVRHYDESKGYGFIEDLESRHSLFFHVNNTKCDLRVNDKVNFEITKGVKGLVAIEITLFKK